jgi:glutathione synthase/RimK-type ligase-like ATP-grasp enzyme
VQRTYYGTQSVGQRLCCGILVERRYLSQTQPCGLIAGLRKRGHEVVVVDPEGHALQAGDNAWLGGLDITVARGRSWAVLTMLGWAEAGGVPTINRRQAIASVFNKADMALQLCAAGLPAPLTYFGSLPQLAERFCPDDYPVILKPVFGDNASGLRLAKDKEDLLRTKWPESVALAQRFIQNNGWDLKLYCIGGDVWAVRKPGPWLQAGDQTGRTCIPELVNITDSWRDLARRCGELFGLELFGVDCVETADGPVIIEVNEFPNYSGIPCVNERLTDYVLARALEESAS